MPETFLCVSIDCECDKGPAWRTQRPLRFEGIATGVVQRLQPLFRRLGAKPTYLLSPEVLRDGESVSQLHRLEPAELGTHLHGEFAEPGAFVPDVTRAAQRDYPPEIERAKLENLTVTFRAAFGRTPRSFRAGRFGVGPRTVPMLEALGYIVESSVTPHVDWSDVSRGLSFCGAPTQPYHPDRRDVGRPGDSTLLEVPITIRPSPLSPLPWLGVRWAPRWLRPTRTSSRALAAIARDEAASAAQARPDAPIVLHAMLHNVEVVAGASPYARTEAAAERILGRLASLLELARDQGIRSIGLGDVPEVFGW